MSLFDHTNKGLDILDRKRPYKSHFGIYIIVNPIFASHCRKHSQKRLLVFRFIMGVDTWEIGSHFP